MVLDGKERKHEEKEENDLEDHDLLIKIDVKLESFMKILDDHTKQISWLQKIVWGGLGGIAGIEILMKFIK